MKSFRDLRRHIGGFLLLRGFIREQQRTNQLLERIASALEQHNAHLWPQQVQPNPDLPAVEVTYASDEQIQELMQIELDLLGATGRMPTDDEVQLEYDRRHMGPLPSISERLS